VVIGGGQLLAANRIMDRSAGAYTNLDKPPLSCWAAPNRIRQVVRDLPDFPPQEGGPCCPLIGVVRLGDRAVEGHHANELGQARNEADESKDAPSIIGQKPINIVDHDKERLGQLPKRAPEAGSR
jgi:hypothetical protein